MQKNIDYDGKDAQRVAALIEKAQQIAEEVKAFPGIIRVIPHYDCDGITSGAIMAKALLREGKKFRLSFVRQLSNDLLKDLGKEGNRLVIFLDTGSGYLDLIRKYVVEKGAKAIVCDHHQVKGEKVSGISHLNPIDYEVTENISGAGVTYLLARSMNPENQDLSHLAIIGAIGDAQMGSVGPDWGLAGLNREILKDAENAGKIRIGKGLRLWGRYTRPLHKALEFSMDPYIPGISGSESMSVQFLQELGINPQRENGEWRTLSELSVEEQQKLAEGIIKERIRSSEENPDWIFGDVYDLLGRPDFQDANEFSTVMNACGKLGRGWLGVSAALEDKEAMEELKKTLAAYRRRIGKAVSWIKNQVESANQDVVKTSELANYVFAEDVIPEDFISNAISIVHKSGILPEKPVFAFAITEEGKYKVSSRASDSIVSKGVSLSEICSGAAEAAGGEGGGHKGAAGATIPLESAGIFIKKVEEILGKHLKTEEKVGYGTDTERDGEEGRKEGETAKGRETGRPEANKKLWQKVEGKGLVRYLGS